MYRTSSGPASIEHPLCYGYRQSGGVTWEIPVEKAEGFQEGSQCLEVILEKSIGAFEGDHHLYVQRCDRWSLPFLCVCQDCRSELGFQ